ncbi:MAG: phytanoyl-CoA dioxygenase family protein [Hyphomonadaceae bacterium]
MSRLDVLAEELEETGRVWFRGALGNEELLNLDQICNVAGRPGLRLDWSRQLDTVLGINSVITRLARSILLNCNPVRLVVFNKSPNSNWLVPWHQDRVIAVDQRCEADGYSNWSQKSGVWHCEPPIDLLYSMIFARVHLDDADKQNGCLQLARGTHKLGLIKASKADEAARAAPIETCVARRGDILFVKALTLHRSEPSKSKAQRRALRVDYSGVSLSAPLEWALTSNRA